MARAKHYSEANAIYHVTTRTLERKPYLTKSVDKQIVLNALDFYRRRGDFALYGFVVMDWPFAGFEDTAGGWGKQGR
jgi:REP element-mobilizing transposase RayT